MSRKPRDLLSWEYRRRHISMAGYAAGEIFREIFERAASDESPGTGATDAQRVRACRMMARQYAVEHRTLVVNHLGQEAFDMLYSVLVDGKSYTEGLSRWLAWQKGQQFRKAVEDLCELYASPAAKGLQSRK